MDKSEIMQKVKEMFAEHLNLEIMQIKDDADLVDDLGLDSMGAVEIEFEIKEKFAIDFSTVEFKDIRTVHDIVELIYSSNKRSAV